TRLAVSEKAVSREQDWELRITACRNSFDGPGDALLDVRVSRHDEDRGEPFIVAREATGVSVFIEGGKLLAIVARLLCPSVVFKEEPVEPALVPIESVTVWAHSAPSTSNGTTPFDQGVVIACESASGRHSVERGKDLVGADCVIKVLEKPRARALRRPP